MNHRVRKYSTNQMIDSILFQCRCLCTYFPANIPLLFYRENMLGKCDWRMVPKATPVQGRRHKRVWETLRLQGSLPWHTAKEEESKREVFSFYSPFCLYDRQSFYGLVRAFWTAVSRSGILMNIVLLRKKVGVPITPYFCPSARSCSIAALVRRLSMQSANFV